MEEFCFAISEENIARKVTDGLSYFFCGRKPVIICIGTDLTIGDSLGPIVGTMLTEANVDAFIYGRLSDMVTAKEVKGMKEFLLKTHPKSKTLVIDAAIGIKEDVGSIKISSAPIRPGLGVNKNLPEMGNVNIIGIVAEKSSANYSFLNLTRLSPIYQMARGISDGITGYFKEIEKINKKMA